VENIDELKEDLRYVASAARLGGDGTVPALFALWAILTPIGFALADFAPFYCGLYWLVVGPVGGIVSVLIAYRGQRRAGQLDRELGQRHALHWSVMGLAFLLVGLSIASGRAEITTAVPTFMLLTAVAYALAGVHLSRAFRLSGAILFLGYAALVWLPLAYVWTITGLIFSAAMFAGALRSRAAQQPSIA
jgi:hypothetical protein